MLKTGLKTHLIRADFFVENFNKININLHKMLFTETTFLRLVTQTCFHFNSHEYHK